jgi:hypothetical protein
MAIVAGQICCSACGTLKPLAEFAPSMAKSGNGCCRVCRRAMNKTAPTQAQLRKYNLKKYGITPEDYDSLLAVQGGACACCKAQRNLDGRRLYVDHCHSTGRVRGLLCYSCNTGIGSLGDDTKGLQRALCYLENPLHIVLNQIPDSKSGWSAGLVL